MTFMDILIEDLEVFPFTHELAAWTISTWTFCVVPVILATSNPAWWRCPPDSWTTDGDDILNQQIRLQ